MDDPQLLDFPHAEVLLIGKRTGVEGECAPCETVQACVLKIDHHEHLNSLKLLLCAKLRARPFH